MKRIVHFALMLLCVLAVSSCKDDDKDEVIDETYKLKNEAAFQEKLNDHTYTKWNSPANNGFVLAKQLKEGTGKQVYYNSRISVYYKGSLIDGTVFDSNLEEDTSIPFRCAVSSAYANYNSYNPNGYTSVIAGWTVALQYMKEGDKWEVWIPQELGYGSSGSGTIQPYTTLIFEIEVASVDEQAVS